MILQIIVLIIMLALFVGSFMCMTVNSDRRGIGLGDDYAWYSVMMMFGAIAAFSFLTFGPNGLLDDSSDNATEVPSVNITPTNVQK